MKMMKIRYFIGLLFISILLSGCGDDLRQRELQDYINKIKLASAQKEVKSKPKTWKLPTPVTYQPGGYSSSTRLGSGKSTSNPLQAYPIKNLKFVGILTKNSQISAYIMTPDSMIYLVKVGDSIGEDYGKIVKIDAEHLEVTERVMKGDQPSERIVTLELKDSPE